MATEEEKEDAKYPCPDHPTAEYTNSKDDLKIG